MTRAMPPCKLHANSSSTSPPSAHSAAVHILQHQVAQRSEVQRDLCARPKRPCVRERKCARTPTRARTVLQACASCMRNQKVHSMMLMLVCKCRQVWLSASMRVRCNICTHLPQAAHTRVFMCTLCAQHLHARCLLCITASRACVGVALAGSRMSTSEHAARTM